MNRFLCVAVFAIAAMISTGALAHDIKQGDLTLHHPWARASIGQAKAGAVYLTIANTGLAPDRLLSAETPAAKVAKLHTHLMKDGVMRMRPVEAIEIAPGAPVVFRPGGLHVMLMGLKAPLREGESFALILTFEKAGRIEIPVQIQGPGAMEPAADSAMPGDHVQGS